MGGFPQNIVLLQEEQLTGPVIVLDPPQEVTITVAERGPKGDPSTVPGPQGPAGPSYQGFTFTQSQPSAQWTIVHNLNRYPDVVIVDSTHTRVYASVTYPDMDTALVTFSAAESGIAYCA